MNNIIPPPNDSNRETITGPAGPYWWTIELQTVDVVAEVVTDITTTNSPAVYEAAGWRLINAGRLLRQTRKVAA